jgi:hypothetical protein
MQPARSPLLLVVPRRAASRPRARREPADLPPARSRAREPAERERTTSEASQLDLRGSLLSTDAHPFRPTAAAGSRSQHAGSISCIILRHTLHLTPAACKWQPSELSAGRHESHLFHRDDGSRKRGIVSCGIAIQSTKFRISAR